MAARIAKRSTSSSQPMPGRIKATSPTISAAAPNQMKNMPGASASTAASTAPRIHQCQNCRGLRAAFGWSRERNAIEEALRIASSLQPLWLSRGRILEGLSWFYAIPADETRPTFDVTPAVHARALADKAMLASVISAPDSLERVERALAIAREIGEPGLLLRALTACGSTAVFIPDVARPYLAEALELARALGDTWRMSQVLWWQAFTATVAGEPAAALEAGFEGSRLAADIGDPFVARMCRFWGIGTAQLMRGEFTAAAAQFRELLAEAEAAHDPFGQLAAQSHLGHTLAHLGDVDGARSAAATAAELGAEFGGFVAGIGYAPLARAALAAGDVAVATEACEVACQKMGTHPIPGANVTPIAEIALARGDLAMARRFADETVSLTSGFNLSLALIARTRVAIAEGDPEQADRDAHKALAVAAAVDSHAPIPEALECLAALACEAESRLEAARLFGAADALRRRMGLVRFQVYDDAYNTSVAAVRNTLTDNEFESAWAEGAAMSASEAIAYAQRGHGVRKGHRTQRIGCRCGDRNERRAGLRTTGAQGFAGRDRRQDIGLDPADLAGRATRQMAGTLSS